MILLLLLVIIGLLIFGPLFAGVLTFLTAVVGGLGAFLILAALGVICILSGLGTVGWFIWWCVDRKAAMESYRAGERYWEGR